MYSSDPKPSPSPPSSSGDFLLHLEAYLAKRDGVDKLLKIFRYATKILLASSFPLSANPRLRAFDSSVGASRKAFRLGKFVQDLNALRRIPSSHHHPHSLAYLALSYLAYGGEGVYYFVEQFVWLVKAGLLPKEYARRLHLVSAWAELVGYVGSVGLKVGEVRRIREGLEKVGEEEEVGKLREKLFLKQLSILQDLADGLMALADVRDGKGYFTGPLLLASAGLLSALISTRKNWSSC